YRKTAGIGAVALATALLISSCGGESTSTTDATESAAPSAAAGVQLVNPGKLTTCTNIPYEPFQFNDENGKVVGFDVDIVDLVAKKLGVEQDIVDIDFAAIKSGAAMNA